MSAHRTAGFTLVEVMIALLIFGMIAAAGVAMLSFSIRAQGTAGARLDDIGAVQRLASILGADLAQAVDRPARDERGVLLPAFVGTATTLRLVRGGWGNIDDAPRASLQKVEYRLAGEAIERVGYPMLDGVEPYPPARCWKGSRRSRCATAFKARGATIGTGRRVRRCRRRWS